MSREKWGWEKIFEEIRAESFPHLVKDINLWIEKLGKP